MLGAAQQAKSEKASLSHGCLDEAVITSFALSIQWQPSPHLQKMTSRGWPLQPGPQPGNNCARLDPFVFLSVTVSLSGALAFFKHFWFRRVGFFKISWNFPLLLAKCCPMLWSSEEGKTCRTGMEPITVLVYSEIHNQLQSWKTGFVHSFLLLMLLFKTVVFVVLRTKRKAYETTQETLQHQKLLGNDRMMS